MRKFLVGGMLAIGWGCWLLAADCGNKPASPATTSVSIPTWPNYALPPADLALALARDGRIEVLALDGVDRAGAFSLPVREARWLYDDIGRALRAIEADPTADIVTILVPESDLIAAYNEGWRDGWDAGYQAGLPPPLDIRTLAGPLTLCGPTTQPEEKP